MVFGVKDVRVCSHHLGGFGRLQALLECAAVGHAPKRAGDELRIVSVAEADEDLILLVGVEIFARIEGVGVLDTGRGCPGRWPMPGIRLGVEIQQLDRVCIDPAALAPVSWFRSGQAASVKFVVARSAFAAERIANDSLRPLSVRQAGDGIHCAAVSHEPCRCRIQDCARFEWTRPMMISSGRVARLLSEDVGEICVKPLLLLHGGRNRVREGGALYAALAFIVAEEEELVLDDRAAAGWRRTGSAAVRPLSGWWSCLQTSPRRRACRCGRTPTPCRAGCWCRT